MNLAWHIGGIVWFTGRDEIRRWRERRISSPPSTVFSGTIMPSWADWSTCVSSGHEVAEPNCTTPTKIYFRGLEPVERPTDPGNDAAFNIFFCFTNS